MTGISAWAFLGFTALTGVFKSSVFNADQWQKSIHGDGMLESTYYPESVPNTNSFLETGRLSFDSTLKRENGWRIKFKPLFQANPLNLSATERYWSELPEGYVQYQDNGWRVQAGYNTFNWGVTDGYNPLDVVDARRYQDPIRQEKLGAPSVAIKKDLGFVSLEAIYIPIQRKSIWPGEQSRWLPRKVLTTTSVGDGVHTAILNLPSELEYHFNPEEDRDHALENNYGFRAEFNGLASGLDVSLHYFEGAAISPAADVIASGVLVQLQPQIIIQADPGVTLVPVYYRQRMYGLSAVYATGGMIFKGEAAITRLISKGQDLLGDAEEFIFGIERPFTVGKQDLTVVLQGTRALHSVPVTNSATSFNRIFDRALLLGARYPFSESFTGLASTLWDTEFHEGMVHLEGSYTLTDAWKLGLGIDYLWGGSETPLGSFDNNERAYLSAKASF